MLCAAAWPESHVWSFEALHRPWGFVDVSYGAADVAGPELVTELSGLRISRAVGGPAEG